MRVKLGDRIYFCTVATYRIGSKDILLTTNNGIYTVLMKSICEADTCHKLLLTKGYYDFTCEEYSN